MMFMRSSPWIVAAAVLVTACQPADEAARLARGLTDAQDDKTHVAVGMLLLGVVGSRAASICGGTLVGSKTVLTAAHCLKPRKGETRFQLFDAEGLSHRTYLAVKVIAHPKWSTGYGHDIGLVLLKTAPKNVTPVPLAQASPEVDDPITFVGYGLTKLGATDEGTRRVGNNRVASKGTFHFTAKGTGGGESNVCDGDSGGAVLSTSGAATIITGVISSNNGRCGEIAYNTTVAAYLDWLKTEALGDLGGAGDVEKPQVSISAPTEGSVVHSPVRVVFLATDNGGAPSVRLSSDGDEVLDNAVSPAVLPLAVGQRTIIATATDGAGNSTSVSVTVTVRTGGSDGSAGDGAVPSDDGGALPANDRPYGSVCDGDAQCTSGMCRSGSGSPATPKCTVECLSAMASCAEGSECISVGNESFCRPVEVSPPGDDGGCSVLLGQPRTGAGGGLSLGALLGIFLWGLRRKRRQRDA